MIDFEKLRPIMSSAFDTDMLVEIKNPDGKLVGENIPCHFVITQADSIGTKENYDLYPLPVQTYGVIYMSDTPTLRAAYKVIVDKRSTNGDTIARYECTTAMPAYSAGRLTANVRIDKVTPGEEPKPPETFCRLVTLDTYGDPVDSVNLFAYHLENRPAPGGGTVEAFFFDDPEFKWVDGKLQVSDPSFAYNPRTITGYGGIDWKDSVVGIRYYFTEDPVMGADGRISSTIEPIETP